MSDNVVGLNGCKVVPADAPVESIVERCRRLLALAESGQLRGLAAVICERNARVRFFWSDDDSELVVGQISSGLLGLTHSWAKDMVVDIDEALSPSPPAA